jgi:hypothetical protein
MRHFATTLVPALFGLSLLLGSTAIADNGAMHVRSLDDVVRVEDLRSDDDDVRGRLVNETDDQIENVRLLVSDQFLWRNERHPGTDSPSDAHAVTVPGPIPPHGSVPFEFRRPSRLADRPDGEFQTEVSAVELTRRSPTTWTSGSTYERRTYERTYQDRPVEQTPPRDADDYR